MGLKRGLYFNVRKLITNVWNQSAEENIWKPKVAVEWLALLHRAQEVPGSNIDPKTSFSWFSSVPPGKRRDDALN
jgi:hypothetical protein